MTLRTLGFDTSNYRTSAALYESETGAFYMAGRLLSVETGKRGLRQSDALFLHTRALPSVADELSEQFGGAFSPDAIGVSDAPRSVEGSYMPCFLAGVSVAETCGRAAGVSVYHFSHQMGHIAAAAVSAGVTDWIYKPFLAWHLSGGTTELVKVTPGKNIFDCEIVFSTSDISAGQAIDRAGVCLGLPFPCGGELERLAQKGDAKPARPSVAENTLSFSGLENKTNDMISKGASPENTAAFVLLSVRKAICAATEKVMSQNPGLPLLCGGGVSANRGLRRDMEALFDAKFPEPSFAGDNAAGVAYLTFLKHSDLF